MSARGTTNLPNRDRSSLAIDNLRAIVIVLVLAFHSALAYLNFLPSHPFPFDQPPYLWRAFPIVDTHRFLGFDLFCAWLDVYLMAFFFMLSGLFAWPSLIRKGAGTFLQDRLLRIGLPFALVVALLVPVAEYPSYMQSIGAGGVAGYWRALRQLPFWPAGPMWFLWLLLGWDLLAAGLHRALRGRGEAVIRLSNYAREHPARFLTGFAAVTAGAYLPLALLYGPSDWYSIGPFPFQLSRPFFYAAYFFAGVAIGACGIERSLLAAEGRLARHWRGWLIAAPLLLFLWMGLTALVRGHPDGSAPVGLQIADDLSFALACFANCLMVLAIAIRFGAQRAPMLESLKANAYGMYLIHYVFVVWLQYALLPVGWPGIVKGAAVFAGTLIASWAGTAALRQVPAIAHVIGDRRAPSARPRPIAPAGSRPQGLAR